MSDGYKPKVIIEGADTDVPRIVVLESKTDEQRKHCVDKLREIIAQAEAGEMSDVIILTFGPARNVGLSWTNLEPAERLHYSGALSLMNHMLLHSVTVAKTPGG